MENDIRHAATCQWGRLSNKGICGSPAVCDIAGADGEIVATCRYHLNVANRQGWEVEMWQDDGKLVP